LAAREKKPRAPRAGMPTGEVVDRKNSRESAADSGALLALEPLRNKIKAAITPALQSHLQPGENADVVAGELMRRTLAVVETQVFQGPIPPPAILEGYENLVPGSAGRLTAMAEREQRHRHNLDLRPMHLDFVYSMSGLICGGLVALSLIAGAYFSAIAGHQAVAGAFLATGAVSMVAGFIKGRQLFAGKKSDGEQPKRTPTSKGTDPPPAMGRTPSAPRQNPRVPRRRK
jgi:uncharacterized membrane protein